MINLVKDCVQL